MTYRCGNCQSLFFKTLEIRVNDAGNALLYKKRCKRCKHKCVLRKNSLQGALQLSGIEDWRRARQSQSTVCAAAPRLLVGEYTARISRAHTPPLDYLNRIAQAQRQEFSP